jgi:hypothetical protein
MKRAPLPAPFSLAEIESQSDKLYNSVESGLDMAETQISAYISEETKQEVELYVGAHGLKKGALVEQALLHHLKALRELPADIIIPPRIELSDKSFLDVAKRISKPRKPSKAMRALMAGKAGKRPDFL